MKRLWCTLILSILLSGADGEENPTPIFDAAAAERFANLALGCVGKEYPNKIRHTLTSAAAEADACVFRMLRLAFVGAWPLAAREAGPQISGGIVRRTRARRAAS